MADFDRLRRELEAVGLDFSGYGLPPSRWRVDPPVLPLLYALNRTGYRTVNSCSGHSFDEFLQEARMHKTLHEEDAFAIGKQAQWYQLMRYDLGNRTLKKIHTRSTHPFVDIKLPDYKLRRMTALVDEYNGQSKVQWGLLHLYADHLSVPVYKLQPSLSESGYPARADLTNLAEFIWEKEHDAKGW